MRQAVKGNRFDPKGSRGTKEPSSGGDPSVYSSGERALRIGKL